MTDSTLNRFLARGTNAQRVAFTPDPPTPASGPSNTYFWYETDTGNTYAWDGSAWGQVNGGLIDGDYGDISISSGVWTVDNGAISYAKMQDVSATNRLLGRVTAGAGDVEEVVLDADTTLAANSDDIVPTQKAVKAYVDASGGFTAASTTEVLTGTDTTKGATPDAIAALWEQGSDVASAATVSLGEGGYFNITGTTTITDIDFATDKAGRKAWVKFAGALTLTHNASTLILPGGANITTAAGDTACFVSEGSDAVRCVAYQRASGAALVAGSSAPWYLSSAPTASSMTLVSGDATNLTLTDDADVGLLFDAGSPVASDKARLAERTVSSPSSDWTLTVMLDPVNVSSNYSTVGITCRDSVGGRLIMFGFDNAGGLIANRYAALGGAYASTVFSGLTIRNFATRWFRMKYLSGTDVIEFYISREGKIWTKVGQETRTAYLANRPDRVGFGVDYNRNSGLTVVGSVGYLTLT